MAADGYGIVAATLAAASGVGLASACARLRLAWHVASPRERLRRARLIVTVASLATMTLGFGLNAAGIWRYDGALNAMIGGLIIVLIAIAVLEWRTARADRAAIEDGAAEPTTRGTTWGGGGDAVSVGAPSQGAAVRHPLGHASAEDPGWRVPWWSVAAAPVAVFLLPRLSRSNRLDLLRLRGMFLAFALSHIHLLLAVVTVLEPRDTARPWWPYALLAGVTVYSAVFGRWMRNKPLPENDPGAFAAVYRARLFLSIAIVSSIALWGFVLAFATEDPLTYIIALVPSSIGFALIAPTRERLGRLRDDLRARGSSVDPYVALNDGRVPAASE